MFTNRKRCTAVQNTVGQVQMGFFARELIQLFYVAFYLVRVVQNIFFGLLIKLTPKKWLGVENDQLNDENYVFVRPSMLCLSLLSTRRKGTLPTLSRIQVVLVSREQ